MSICIVTPVLNAVSTIDNTIWSVLTQQTRNCCTDSLSIRYHIQDGGSSDGTIEKLQQWEKKIQSSADILPSSFEFTWASEADTGMYDAINKGFAHCTLDANAFMGWINADDVLLPGALDTIDNIACQYSQVEWLLGWQILLSNGGTLLLLNKNIFHSGKIIRAGIMDGILWPWIQQESSFWKKSLWDKVGGVNSSLKYAGDYALWLSFAQHADPFKVERQLGSFSRRKNQITSDMASYYAEMNTCVDALTREKNFLQLLESNVLLEKLPSFAENEDGLMRLIQDGYGTKKKVAHFLYKYFRKIPIINQKLYSRIINIK